MDETPFPPRRSTGALLLIVIFVLGMVGGASLFYIGQRSVGGSRPPYEDRGGPPPRDPLSHMTQTLDLDAEQREQIRAILDQYRGEMDEMLEASRLEIRDVLNPEQQTQFDSLRPQRLGPGGPGGHRPPRGKRPPGRDGHPPGGRPGGRRPPPGG
jgi:Spy/CpxP family protein refolding chaperone